MVEISRCTLLVHVLSSWPELIPKQDDLHYGIHVLAVLKRCPEFEELVKKDSMYVSLLWRDVLDADGPVARQQIWNKTTPERLALAYHRLLELMTDLLLDDLGECIPFVEGVEHALRRKLVEIPPQQM